ncbi:hypothetical protein ACQPX6_01140 [Actinomycetospora sp. CA-101289]|uniref:HNH endonuclease signature motif containing protein n=1 Tax=Actinomycetospora sp. CA-101289 TaxID=3239893 RepID=UPI003D96ADC9
MFEDGWQVVPAGVEELPAGAALAAVLEGLDPARVSPFDTVRLVAAQRRQLAHQQAVFHACAREAALADPGAPGGRADRDVPAAGDELRAVLAASRTAVARLLDVADGAARYPRLGERWRAGGIDEARVAILVRWTSALSSEHAGQVIDRLVDEAAGLTPSRLIDRVQALAKALDPGWAEKLYRQARRQRRVRARCTEAGTVNLSALDLPLAAGVRSVRRVNALAARVQAAGHPGLIDTIRADVICALLHPRSAGATDAEIVAAVLAAAHPDDPQPRRTPDPAQAPPDDPTPPDEPTLDDPAPADDPGSADDPAPAEDPAAADDPAPTDDPAAGVGRRSTRQSRFELRVGLGTLLELDDRPARLPGWGVITAGLARELAAAYSDAEWRVAVTDHSGALVAALLTRHRPTHTTASPLEPAIPGAPRPVIELHVTAAQLDQLRPTDHPAWTRLLTDLHHQHQLWRTARTARTNDDADDHGSREALARFPSVALRRWITIRDRSCVFPPCGASALAAEIDHTRPVIEHGLTVPGNLGPACGHDHDLKDQGWTLHQPRPGWFTWTSPTGHTYPRPPQAITDALPDPQPPAVPSSTEPDRYADDGPLWDRPPAPPPRPPPTPTDQDPDPPF